MARLSLVDPSTAEAPVADLLRRIAGDRGQVFNVYRALAVSPGALEHVYGLASYLWRESTLDPRVQELVILRVAQLTGSDYEWARHRPLASRAGASDAQVEALAGWRTAEPGRFDATERAALALAEEATCEIEASAGTVAAASEALGERGALELLVLAGFYGMVARVLRSLAVDGEPGDAPMPRRDAGQKRERTHYVRIHAAADGETHFEDVRLPTERRRSPVSSAQVDLTAPLVATGVVFRSVAVDHPAEPHPAPQRQLVVHLAGEAEVEVSDGEVRRFGPGSVLLVEDLTGKGHTTRAVGEVGRQTLMIPLEDVPEQD